MINIFICELKELYKGKDWLIKIDFGVNSGGYYIVCMAKDEHINKVFKEKIKVLPDFEALPSFYKEVPIVIVNENF